MRLIARKYLAVPRLLSPDEYAAEMGKLDQRSFKIAIERGEPYFIGVNKPLIYALGRGTYWRHSLGQTYVYGEGVEAMNREQSEEILSARREGYVYGKWFSEYAPEGELGYVHQRSLTSISSRDFLSALQKIGPK